MWSFTDLFGIRCGGVQFLPLLEIFGGPSPKSMGKSTAPCGQKSEGHEEIKATYFCKCTPPKFDIAPEKWWLEDYFPIGMAYFQGLS